ncbi:MAG: T9SS type A sorting domain-containing protein [Bacteroidota bacterium]
MKLYIPILTLFLAGSAFAQIDHELRFDCFDHNETKCNPFAISSPSYPDQGIYKNNWRVSHGSPQLRAFSSNNPTRVAVLKAVDTDGVSPKGEGIFLAYNFLANCDYTIEYILRIEDPSFFTTISLTSKVANGLTAKTNATVCNEETLPTVSDTQTILTEAPLPFESGNELGLITVSNFIPTKNFSNLWVYAVPEGFGNPTSEFIISHITITDVTDNGGGSGNSDEITNNTICCDQTFPFSNSAYPAEVVGSIPNGGDGSYDYQWYYKTTLPFFSPITGEIDKNYNPPISQGRTSYMRYVTSGSYTSNSNSIVIQVGDEANNFYPYNIVATNISGSKVKITWDQLSEDVSYHHSNIDLNGDRVGYHYNGDAFSFMLDDLSPCTEYTLRITAVLYDYRVSAFPFYRGTNFTFTTAQDIPESLVLNNNLTEYITLLYRAENVTLANGFHFKAENSNHSFLVSSIPEPCNNSSRTTSTQDNTVYIGFGDASPIVTYGVYNHDEQVFSGNEEMQFILYPNPSRGTVVLNFSDPDNSSNGEIVIYDLLGNEVFKEIVFSEENSIKLDLSFLQAGNYYLKYLGSKYVVTKKIMLK